MSRWDTRAKEVSAIQIEQLQLVKVQNELEGILGKINEAVNALKVEELQLKSSAVAAMTKESKPTTSVVRSEVPQISLKIEGNDDFCDRYEICEIDEVNKQEIDLDMFVWDGKRNREIEEEEEESD